MTDPSSSDGSPIDASPVSVDEVDPSPSDGGFGTPGASAVERAAAERVVAAWGGEAGTEEELRGELSAIVALAARTRDEDAVPDCSGEATALRLELLDHLRRELLALPAGEADPRELLVVLRSLEDVRDELGTDWSRRFGLVRAAPCGIDVAAEIAHGLRSSCTSLLFATEVLREGMYGELNAKQKQQVEVLYGGAVGLTAGLSDITELAWRAKERGERSTGSFDLGEDVDAVRGLLRPIAEAGGTDLSFVVEAQPHRTGPSGALRRALLNLILHALKRSEGGSVEVTIHEQDPTILRIEVRGRSEDGPDPELHDDPFRILRRAVGEDGYSFSLPGLRLHTARELIRSLDGELEHRDEDGRIDFGFSLRVPRAG